MKVSEYRSQGIALESLSLARLRGIDITTPEEEKLIQGLVAQRLQRTPVKKPLNLSSDRTDFKTKDEEEAFQKVVDARKASHLPEVPVTEEILQAQEATLKTKITKLKKARKTLK